ncbi:MAG: hypothetical protein H7067_01235 [Burkholderiales bacterium]|nr:hypothetical protein [Opitutaceae bacterium]
MAPTSEDPGHLRLNPQLKYLLRHSRLLRRLLVPRLVCRHYAAYYRRPLSRDRPRSMADIINWAKAWGDLERYAPFADKYQVRHYIKAVAGESHLVPLLAVVERAADLNWDALPSAFVLKTNHGSGWNVLVPDKASADRAAINARLDHWLSQSFFLHSLESQYARIKPCIIAEAYIGNPQTIPSDYKITCARGVPLHIQADYDRTDRHTRAFLDIDWHLMKVRDGCQSPEVAPPRPTGLARMLDLAAKLSRPFPFVRVDFYEDDGHVYVGELTFTPASGLYFVDPPEFDLVFGHGVDVTAYRLPLEVDPEIFRLA